MFYLSSTHNCHQLQPFSRLSQLATLRAAFGGYRYELHWMFERNGCSDTLISTYLFPFPHLNVDLEEMNHEKLFFLVQYAVDYCTSRGDGEGSKPSRAGFPLPCLVNVYRDIRYSSRNSWSRRTLSTDIFPRNRQLLAAAGLLMANNSSKPTQTPPNCATGYLSETGTLSG